MGSTNSKLEVRTADVIKNIEVIDHKDDIVQINRVLLFIMGLLIVNLLLEGHRTYQKMIKKPKDRSYEVEKGEPDAFNKMII